jgi:hypothetical protein
LFTAESAGDDKSEATTLRGNGDVLVHLVTLDHEQKWRRKCSISVSQRA